MFGGIAVAKNLLCVASADARGRVFLVDLDERRVVSSWEFGPLDAPRQCITKSTHPLYPNQRMNRIGTLIRMAHSLIVYNQMKNVLFISSAR